VEAWAMNPLDGASAGLADKNQDWEYRNANRAPRATKFLRQFRSQRRRLELPKSEPMRRDQEQRIEMRIHRQGTGDHVKNKCAREGLLDRAKKEQTGQRAQEHQQGIATSFLRIANMVRIDGQQGCGEQRRFTVE